MNDAPGLHVEPLAGMPLFTVGMSVASEIGAALARSGNVVRDGDVIVVAQKIVSKSEGRFARLADVTPGEEARRMAAETGRDPAMIQLILNESSGILRATPAAIIARHRTGHVLANAGIDASNVEGGEAGTVLLWPVDPDASARAIRAGLAEITGKRLAVIVADSMGRPWRIGTVGGAIGCAGIAVLEDRRGKARDLFGRTLQATVIAVADSLAAAAALAMGEGAEGTPAALMRGAAKWVAQADGPGGAGILRPVAEDMFR